MFHLGQLLERRSPTILERYQLKELEIRHWTSLVCDYPREFQESLSRVIEYAYPSERKFVLDDVLVGWLERASRIYRDFPLFFGSIFEKIKKNVR